MPDVIEVRPIGWVESSLVDPADAPKQGDEGAPDAWVRFRPEVAEGLRDIAPGDRLVVLTWPDRADRDVLVVEPGRVRVSDLEAVDGTPVIDCKPELEPLPLR